MKEGSHRTDSTRDTERIAFAKEVLELVTAVVVLVTVILATR